MPALSEQDFLKNLIIDRFNLQKNTTLLANDFSIYSIPTSNNDGVAYSLYSNNTAIKTKLSVYFSFGKYDSVDYFSLESTGSISAGTLDDEIEVSSGTLSDRYRADNIYLFPWISRYHSGETVVLTEDNEVVTDENGEPISLESVF